METQHPDEVSPSNAIGSPVQRREDLPLLAGTAEFTDDIHAPGAAHLAIVRSQYAHATIEDIDTSRAKALDGIIEVFTARDVEESGVPGTIPVRWFLPDLATPPFPMLAGEKVRYQGQPLAVVIGEDRYAARDGAEAVQVEYEPLEAVVNPMSAIEDGAPTVHDEAGDNRAFDWGIGDPEATEASIAEADHVVEIDLENQRLQATPMEPRGAVAAYSPWTEELDVTMSSQNPHFHRTMLSEVLGIPEHHLHVRAPDVGGGFGAKTPLYPGESLTAWCATQLDRPVRWQSTRTEGCLGDAHGRDHRTSARLAVDADGTLQGLEVETVANLGAYLSVFGAIIPSAIYASTLSGQYDIPEIHCSVTGAFTTTAPVDAYRGAGKPESAFVVERLVKLAAMELDIDPVELRRQNLINPDEFPYETPTGTVYDSGDYEPALERALELADLDEMRERQARLRSEGRYFGVGLAAYIESSGLGPSNLAGMFGALDGFSELGIVRFHRSGKVTAQVGTSGHGQGHGTTYAQVISKELGVPIDDVEVVESDTDEVPMGMGTFGSRSAAVGGNALHESARNVVEKARRIAAHHLEAESDDIEFVDGDFRVVGAPDRSMSIQAVAREAITGHDLPDGVEPGLEATSHYDPANFTHPFGTHVAVVEVDPDTGAVDILRYVAVDDCGTRLNPMVVEGQLHGAIAQGLGQALYEEATYDEHGNLATASMQDYAVPKAFHVPDLELDETVTPSPHNPLGVKGVGEAGTIATPPAVVNAVVDALSPLGIKHIDMPLTDESVWRAINQANEDTAGS